MPLEPSGYAPNRYSLRSTLLWLVAVCIVPAACVIAYLLWQVYELERQQVFNSTSLLARKVAADLDRELSAIESGLHVLAESRQLQTGDLEAFHAFAGRAVTTQIVYNYVLLDRQGRQVLNTVVPYGSPLPATGNPVELQAVFETGATVLTNFFIGPVTRRPAVAMGVPVHIDGHIRYVLAVGMSLDAVGHILAANTLAPGWLVAILDASGTIVGRTRAPDQFVGQKATPQLLERVANQREGTFVSVNKEGDPVYTGFSRGVKFDWVVAAGAPMHAVEAQVVDWLFSASLGIGVAMLLGVWMALRVVRKVVSTVEDLNEAARHIGDQEPVKLPRISLKEADAVGQAIVQASLTAAQIRHMAHHDALTGLANRWLFDELLQHQLERAKRAEGGLAVLALDLDGFKAVNDRYGHAAGDKVLIEVAKRIALVVRSMDTVARMGGDEFAVLLADAKEPEGIDQIAARLLEGLSRPYEGVDCPLSVSIGVAQYPATAHAASDLLQRADEALYEAKQAGKWRVVWAR
jgi:diguanylate cyclase (GGDEF)-like protein